MAVKSHIVVFYVMTPCCNLVGDYQCVVEPSTFNPEDGNLSKILVANYQNTTQSHNTEHHNMNIISIIPHLKHMIYKLSKNKSISIILSALQVCVKLHNPKTYMKMGTRGNYVIRNCDIYMV
jgi:hypothetical protein